MRTNVWRALAKQVTNGHIPEATIGDFQALLQEHKMTERYLDELGFDTSIKPSELAYIDNLILPDRGLLIPEAEGIVIQVMGMPNSGKSTQLINFTSLYPHIYLTKEWSKEAKLWLQEHHAYTPKSRQTIQLGYRSRELIDIFEKAKAEESGLKPEIVMDRGPVDLAIFDRSYFLEGMLSSDTFKATTPFYLLQLTHSYEYSTRTGFIVCLTSPQKSLERKDPNENAYPLQKLPEIMTEQFLSTLYKQYIRFHYEALNNTKITGNPTTYAYACLNMESDDYESSQLRLNNTILQMFAHFRENDN